MNKKVLFIGFSAVQLELAKKLLAFRKLTEQITLLSEQRSGERVDAYVLNSDHQGGAQRLALYARLHPAPVLCIGPQHQAKAHAFLPGAFKLNSVDALWELLTHGALQSAPAPASTARPPQATPIPAALPQGGGAVNAEVLVVDDSDIVRRSMVRRLNDYGKQVHLAASGEDALAMLPGSHYRVIFLDVMMAGLDGFEVCKRIKRSREYKSVAVYMLTSKDGVFDKVRASMAGCDGYLLKPLESHKLHEVLDKHFERPGQPASSTPPESSNPAKPGAAEAASLAGGLPKKGPAPDGFARPRPMPLPLGVSPPKPG